MFHSRSVHFKLIFLAGTVLGNFNQLTYHPVSGKIVAKDPHTILICNFIYDGQGPDAFLIVGNRQAGNQPNSRDAIPILPPAKTSSPSLKKKFYFKDKVKTAMNNHSCVLKRRGLTMTSFIQL